MSEKITIQDIIELIAEKHSMNKKDVELFVKGIFDLIEEALTSEKYVKVKGLGTFKLTEVDSRESVNVNTGERIEIQGHTKISFTPDTSMRDLINKPFAHFETVILNENTNLADTETEIEGEDTNEDFIREQEKEAVIISTDKPSETIEVIAESTPQTTEETSINETVVITEEISSAKEPVGENIKEELITPEINISEKQEDTLTEEKKEEIQPESIKEDNTETTAIADTISIIETERNDISNIYEQEKQEQEEKKVVETMTIADAAIEAAKEEKTLSETITPEMITPPDDTEIPVAKSLEEKQKEKRKKDIPWGIIVAIMLVLGIVGGIIWYMQSADKHIKPIPKVTPATNVEPKDSSANIAYPDTLIVKDTLAASLQSVTTTVEPQPLTPEIPKTVAAKTGGNQEVAKVTLADTVEYEIIGTKTNHTLQEGESIIKLSVKFYGTKKLWPYIVKHNQNVIKNADRVPVGTTLRIPELTPKK